MRSVLQVGLLAACCMLPAHAGPLPLTFEYRLNRAPDSPFRPLTRTTLFYGSTTFRVNTSAPYRILGVEVIGEAVHLDSGQQAARCQSTEPPNRCTVDFGDVVAGQPFTVAVRVGNARDNSLQRVSRRFVTLDAHPSSDSISPAGVLVEHTDSDAHSPDHVVRLVRVQCVEGGRKNRQVHYVNDLGAESFRAKVKGIKGAKILSAHPPNDSVPLLIPILFNVSRYLVSGVHRKSVFGWSDRLADAVSALQQGLRGAARQGVDAEYVLAAYAATGRVFGPFRLIPGDDLSAPERAANDATLERLERFLTQPPLDAWNRRARLLFVDNFGSVVHTLNDIYLREFEGLVQGL